MRERTGVASSVFVLTADELARVAADNPFLVDATDPSRLYVTFLAKGLRRADLAPPDPETIAPDQLRVGRRAVYHWCPEGLLACRVPATYWRAFSAGATTRNWRTVTRLLDRVDRG